MPKFLIKAGTTAITALTAMTVAGATAALAAPATAPAHRASASCTGPNTGQSNGLCVRVTVGSDGQGQPVIRSFTATIEQPTFATWSGNVDVFVRQPGDPTGMAYRAEDVGVSADWVSPYTNT
jgi:hypothetical protein